MSNIPDDGRTGTTGTRPPLTTYHLRVLREVKAGNVTVVPAGAAMAPGGHPTRRQVVTHTVAVLLVTDHIEIGPGHGARRIPVHLSTRGRELLAEAMPVPGWRDRW